MTRAELRTHDRLPFRFPSPSDPIRRTLDGRLIVAGLTLAVVSAVALLMLAGAP